MPSLLNIGPKIKYMGSQCNDSPTPFFLAIFQRIIFLIRNVFGSYFWLVYVNNFLLVILADLHWWFYFCYFWLAYYNDSVFLIQSGFFLWFCLCDLWLLSEIFYVSMISGRLSDIDSVSVFLVAFCLWNSFFLYNYSVSVFLVVFCLWNSFWYNNYVSAFLNSFLSL